MGNRVANVIVETLPLAVGIALNPVAVVASILIARGPRSRRNGAGFVAGWIIGLVLLVAMPTLVALDRLRDRADLPPLLLAGLWIGLAIVLFLFAANALRTRPAPGEPTEPQRWTRLVSQGGLVRVIGIGFLLAAFSLRNLALLAAAAGVFGQTELMLLELILSFAGFVAVSSAGVLVPVFVRLLGGDAADATLDRWSTWLTRHMQTITALISVLLGGYLLVKGIAVLF
jgi:hypothetical protein